MNTIEILSRLEKVKFTTEQARTITEIVEDRQYQLATKDDVKTLREDVKANYIATKEDVKANYIATKEDMKNMDAKMATKNDLKILATKDGLQAEILKSKYDLVKWIVGGLIANGMVNALLKYLG